ncbi:response regulator [Algoriphagus halophilus]|uniref:Response regulator receiver domain-containing protein n=1 Tax=Algoriphagus halophilus TaxID=226505 RepID=A0A1N6GZT7_9BACT|nr:response regulator [Algoriphagus halophilus]SIO13016.1 Response regulator receiver domain-containing protein [Algoriphagus halophilus]
MRVLVVDDDEIHLLILRKIFEKSHDMVVTAHNGLEALKVLETDHGFHVILTDIVMPEMDGIEFLMNFKKQDFSKRIPVIGFTAGDVEYYRKKSAIAFDSLVSKPLDFYDLYTLAKLKVDAQLN